MLLTTFGLTVFTDLTIAVGVGMVLASMLFIQRMANVVNVSAHHRRTRQRRADELEAAGDPNATSRRDIPPGVEVYEINGPFFFGVADRLQDTLRGLEKPPRIFILHCRRVPAIDATGLHALREFLIKCRKQGTTLLLSGVHAQPLYAFINIGFDHEVGVENLFGSLDAALSQARSLLGLPAIPTPPGALSEVARER